MKKNKIQFSKGQKTKNSLEENIISKRTYAKSSNSLVEKVFKKLSYPVRKMMILSSDNSFERI